MTDEMKILREYAELKKQEKALAVQIAELQPQVLGVMKTHMADELDTGFGKFILSKRRSYTYSPAVSDLEADLKGRKAEEEANGTASYAEKEVLMFKAIS